MEVFRRAGADQPFPDVAMADQPRDPAQHLDVLTGGGLGTDDEEEDRTDCPSRESNGTGVAETPATRLSWLTVGDLPCGMATPNPMPVLELLLPLYYRPVRIVVVAAGPVHQPLYQLSNGPGFVGRSHRHRRALGRRRTRLTSTAGHGAWMRT